MPELNIKTPEIKAALEAAFIIGCKLHACEMVMNDKIAEVVGGMKDGGDQFLKSAERAALKEWRRQGFPLGYQKDAKG